jgi:hypothetical protein
VLIVPENKGALGPLLGFAGGFVILVYGLYELSIGDSLQSLLNVTGFPVNSSVSGLIDAGWLGVILGILILLAAIATAIVPFYHSSLGALMILLSLLSLLCVLSLGSLGAGDSVGFLLVVLGGTFSVVVGPEMASLEGAPLPIDPSQSWVPAAQSAPTPPEPPMGAGSPGAPGRTSRGCLKCGKVVPVAFTSCPSCGYTF